MAAATVLRDFSGTSQVTCQMQSLLSVEIRRRKSGNVNGPVGAGLRTGHGNDATKEPGLDVERGHFEGLPLRVLFLLVVVSVIIAGQVIQHELSLLRRQEFRSLRV